MNPEDWMKEAACRDSGLDFFMRADVEGFVRAEGRRLLAEYPARCDCGWWDHDPCWPWKKVDP